MFVHDGLRTEPHHGHTLFCVIPSNLKWLDRFRDRNWRGETSATGKECEPQKYSDSLCSVEITPLWVIASLTLVADDDYNILENGSINFLNLYD